MAQGWLKIPFELTGRRVWVAGHRGMVGSAMVKRLESEGCEILTATRNAVDLRNQSATRAWVQRYEPDVIIIAAAKVGGILANSKYPADFLYDNLMIATNIIRSAARCGVDKLLFLGSSCIYPKFAAQPIKESSLLTGALEPTNEAYAIAKIAGIKLCQAYRAQHACDFISAMPCNLYGPGDNFHPENSHVIPALMMKAHEAKIEGAPAMTVWGSGKPRREFLHVDDLAEALIFLLKRYSGFEPVNAGAGADITIADLAREIARATGYSGKVIFDATKPDGTPRKLMDSARIFAAGWRPRINLPQGLAETYAWLQRNEAFLRAA